MPQLGCNIEGPRQPFSPKGAASQHMTVFLQGDMTLHWDDGTTDAYVASNAVVLDTNGTTMVNGNQHVDARTTTWVLATFSGASQTVGAQQFGLYFVSLHDVLVTGLDTIFTAAAHSFTGTAKNWAILAWLMGTEVFLHDQAASLGTGVAFSGTPAKGDILYYDGGWQLLHVPGSALPLNEHYVLSDGSAGTADPFWEVWEFMPHGAHTGDILYYIVGTGWVILVPPSAPGTGANNFLVSGGSAPGWVNYPLIPPASVGAGAVLYSDGTSYQYLSPPGGAPPAGKAWYLNFDMGLNRPNWYAGPA